MSPTRSSSKKQVPVQAGHAADLWAVAQEVPDVYGISGPPAPAYDSLGGAEYVKRHSEEAVNYIVSAMDEKVHEGKAERGEVDKKAIKAGMATNAEVMREMHKPGGLLGPEMKEVIAKREAKLVAESNVLAKL